MAEDYVLFSAVTIGSGTGPIVLSANLTPPDAPTGGTLVTDNYSGSWNQTFSLLPLPTMSNLYVLMHTTSGFYARVMGQDQQVQLLPFGPFDPSFYFSFTGQGPQNLVISSAVGNNLCLSVPGSNWNPGSPVVSSTYQTGTAGVLWQLLPVDRHNAA